jgi:mRNA interferase MazF
LHQDAAHAVQQVMRFAQCYLGQFMSSWSLRVTSQFALVVSPSAYNAKTGLLLCCPTTNQVKGYPFEVTVEGCPPGVALADQVKSLDWVAHKAQLQRRASSDELAQVRAKIMALVGK